jgi:hypothetical protein
MEMRAGSVVASSFLQPLESPLSQRTGTSNAAMDIPEMPRIDDWRL